MDPKSSSSSLQPGNQFLRRLVLLVLAAILILAVTFAGYYYWDRYVHLGDQSPVELGIEQLEGLVRENPDDPEARLALAQHYFENREYNRALDQANQILRAYPDHDGALYVLGLTYTQAGQPEAAIEPLEKFVAIRREDPMSGADTILESALYFLGQNYLELNQTDKAIPILVEALTIDRTDADAMYQLGLAYNRNNQVELAIEQFEKAVSFVPNFAEAYQGMAAGYTALSMPHHVTYARGMEAFSLKDYSRALALLQQSATNLPAFVPVHLGLGLTYEHLGDLEQAQVEIERVLELDPGNFNASYALGRIQQAGSGGG